MLALSLDVNSAFDRRLTPSGAPTLSPPRTVAAPRLPGALTVGSEVTADAGVWVGTPAPTLAFAWNRDGAPIPGATGARYTPGAADDGAALSVTVTASSAAGAASAESAPARVAYPAPVVTGALADATLIQGGGSVVRDAGGLISGAAGGSWSVTVDGAAAPAVATIDKTGQVMISDSALLADAVVTARYANSGGAAAVAFRVTVAAAPVVFDPSGWSVADERSGGALLVSLTAYPSLPVGERLARIEYSLNGAAPLTAGLPGAGFRISGLTNDAAVAVALRIVTDKGAGDWSAPKLSTPTAPAVSAPDAFSPGQWTLGAAGAAGAAEIILSGLPPDGGAAIAGVDWRVNGGAWSDAAALSSVAPWSDLAPTKTWRSTASAPDWSETSDVAPFVSYQSPWGAWDMAPGDVFNAELRADQTLSPAWPALRTVTGPLQLGAGLPKGAPMIILGAHFNLTSAPNPFTTGGLRGIRSESIDEWTAATRVRDRSAPDASLNIAVQTYATVAPTQATGWIDGNTEQWFDIQVRHWWSNFPLPPIERLRATVTLGGVEYAIYRNPAEGTVRPGAGTIGYGVIPTTQTLRPRHDMKAIFDWIVADHNAVTAQSLPGLYVYQCATWVEPRSGFVDATIEGFEVRLNGVIYGRLNRAAGGVTLNTPYTITGLADDVAVSVDLRAVNSAGAGAAGAAKTVTPFIAPVAPAGLAVSIAESSLSFGDTATAVVSVSGYPAPVLTYQWTDDAVDVDGQTNAAFEGVPVGALRVRVTATNASGSAGPVTSAPVTVTAELPGAFSAGQWAADATGASGAVAITLLGLPPANGAAITSVERQLDGGAWVALAGVALNTPYTLTGLTNDQIYSIVLRAVNSVGAGPGGDAKLEAPFAPAVPATLGDNEWTLQPVPSSGDLELALLRPLTDETALALEIGAVSKPEATFAALATGPVALDAPLITGTPALGATMTAGNGRWVSNTGVTGYSWQWERDGANISGATSATYVLVSGDASTSLTVAVTATDAQGAVAATSAATAIPSFGVAPNVTAASFSGTAVTGNTLTASYTEATGSPAPTITYQWKRAGAAIGGATAATYVPTLAGSHTVVVTATNASGASSLESAATTIAPALFAVAVGALKNAAAFALGDAAWSNNASTTATAITAVGPYLSPRTVAVSTADTFRGRSASLGSLTSGVTYRCSAVVKPGVNGRTQVMLEVGSKSATVYTTNFTTVTVSHSATRPGTITNAVIEDAGDGFARLRFDYTPAATATHTIRITPFSSGAGSSVDAYGVGAADQV